MDWKFWAILGGSGAFINGEALLQSASCQYGVTYRFGVFGRYRFVSRSLVCCLYALEMKTSMVETPSMLDDLELLDDSFIKCRYASFRFGLRFEYFCGSLMWKLCLWISVGSESLNLLG
ncbi:hypothetical protein Nepgr_030805 [Nepenthes gracilis]|uniref:Uncharacterized protein n=1 Tax=Nepenthes gracilis TaxID=150966 RepID=A0AAD3Y456_NEPGR|nr:hypothetical protein Nepgr_030805 [Nepenthes gracilis]